MLRQKDNFFNSNKVIKRKKERKEKRKKRERKKEIKKQVERKITGKRGINKNDVNT